MKRVHYSLIFVVTFFLMQLLLFPISLILGSMFPEMSASELNMWSTYANILIHLLVVILFIFLANRHHDKSSIEKNPQAERKHLLMIIVAGFFAVIVAQFIAAVVHQYVFDIDWVGGNTETILQMVRDVPLILIVVVVLGPIIEEFVFRRAIFGELYERLPGPKVVTFIIAFIVSAMLFAVMHGDTTHILVYLLMSLVFSGLYVITGRIIVPIIVHILMNAAVTSYLLITRSNEDVGVNEIIQTITSFI